MFTKQEQEDFFSNALPVKQVAKLGAGMIAAWAFCACLAASLLVGVVYAIFLMLEHFGVIGA